MRFAIAVVAAATLAAACTNVLVTPGASQDGSAFLTYNADSSALMGTMHYAPHSFWPENSTRDVYDWDSGVYLGKIAQVSETFTVVGNMNEYQLAITETTYGGLEELQHQTGAVVDYGSLIYITLERARNAREAIRTMGELVATYGYYSEGESFSIADPNEVWIMEMIGKGEYEMGAVWVARRVPDGYVCSHANQARIQTFPLNDPETCIYSDDVISFAKAHGLYPASAPDAQFSFSDVYNPLTFLNARACEARVWSVFRKIVGAQQMDQYLDYVLGRDLTHRMPLWVLPTKKLSLNDTMMFMRDHYEGTALDFTADVGAEAFGAPYRRSLMFDYAGKHYLHERAISVIQTGFAIVTQSRAWLPREIGGVIWFAVDDAATTVYFPMYTSANRAPQSYTGGDMMDADFGKAWWAFSLLANFVYPRWNLVYPEVFAKIDSLEAKYMAEVPQVDAKAQILYRNNPAEAVQYVTEYSVKTGDKLTADWFAYFRYIFARYQDVYLKQGPIGQRPKISSPGYRAPWLEKIVRETGDRYVMPDEASKSLKRVPKFMQ